MQRETLIEKDEISDSRSVKNSAPTVKNTNSKKKTLWDSTKAKTSAALIALGAVYGDSGTSPVYAPKALMIGQDGTMDRQQVIGSLSPVFWPVMLVVTVKYVLTAMLADDNGRRVRVVRRCPQALEALGDLRDDRRCRVHGFTPAVSITSAVEGLESIPFVRNSGWTQELAVMVSIVIILLLFAVQSGGTSELGRLFGPVMTVWFLFMGIIGVLNLSGDWSVLAALNPFAGISFLFSDANKAGVAIMGSVFLSITGAEALYSDMGHVGRRSIYVTWPSVCVCLMLSLARGLGCWVDALRP